MRHTHKMVTNTSGNAGRALSFARNMNKVLSCNFAQVCVAGMETMTQHGNCYMYSGKRKEGVPYTLWQTGCL